MYLEKSNNKSDFIIRYKTLNGLYQTFIALFSTTCFCIYRVVQERNEGMLGPQLWEVQIILAIMLFVHFWQLFANHI